MSKTGDWEVNDDDFYCANCESKVERPDECFIDSDNELLCDFCYNKYAFEEGEYTFNKETSHCDIGSQCEDFVQDGYAPYYK